MRIAHTALLIGLAAAPALAQPIIIPLQREPKQPPSPMASAPPVAPPQAAPSIPPTGIARGADTVQQEEAYQPADRPTPPAPSR